MKSSQINSKNNTLPIVTSLIPEFENILGKDNFDFILFGSVAIDEYIEGYSDIDIVVLSYKALSDIHTNKLLMLRQELSKATNDSHYILFEGIITSKESFLLKKESTTVYWGTSGQRIVPSYFLSAFDIISILSYGLVIYGKDCRDKIQIPSINDIFTQIKSTYNAIYNYGKVTENPHSLSWFFEVARSLYTLETGKTTSKRMALEWVIEKRSYEDNALLNDILRLRSDIALFGREPYTIEWILSLTPKLQAFANVLEKELKLYSHIN